MRLVSALEALLVLPTLLGAERPIFLDKAAETGLLFRHATGAAGRFSMPEIMGSGVALLDYDGDGDLDVYLLQGAPLDPATQERPRPNQLFCNLLSESGKLRFADVTAKAGLGHRGFGMGVATGDYDGDGDVDLFVSNYGPDALYRNEGEGAFANVTKEAGLGDPAFGASAVFLDYDRDGDLDLFLTRYNAFTVEGSKDCHGHAGERDYCGPLEYAALPDRLYRNDGGGRFSDVTAEAGVDQAFGNGLGVAAADFDGDGWIDIYVANDKTPNQLWLNQRNGAFLDDALFAGVAYNADGMAEAGMGVAAGDYDADGDLDLFLTHIAGETNTLYRNEGGGLFEDATVAAGLAHPSVAATGFGVNWLDFDNDGDLDLFAVNGRVRRGDSNNGAFPYDQPNQLFRNTGSGFKDVSRQAGKAVTRSLVSRGAAFGDVDNDGDIDVVVNNANGPAQLLLNQSNGDAHWLLARLLDRDGSDAHGARAAVLRRRKKPLWREAGAGGSYLSAGDPRLHFGLGREAQVESVRVIWPDGAEERFAIKEVDRIAVLERGGGQPAAAALRGRDVAR